MYPLRVDARLEEPINRWLWLFKLILVIPHVIVLIGLWLAALVTTTIAGVAILITGRYPRALFEFAVGVLRWSWRVSFYTTGAFGTDRYPPFRLGSDPSYPADLSIAYPNQLSRGLVLVKWWLLAIPQYVVVGLFAGGWGATHVGLITVLSIVAAATVLFTGTYPPALFDLVVGLNRWCLRVAAYACLLTDAYPPFRLDMGGADPASSPVPRPVEGSPGPVPTPVTSG
jgi:hypothetical protein